MSASSSQPARRQVVAGLGRPRDGSVAAAHHYPAAGHAPPSLSMARRSAASADTPLHAMAAARRICTSEDCPMATMLEAMPNLCDLEPPRSEQQPPSAEERALLTRYEAVKPYSDKVWGPASWTALEADILSLPEKLDAHEFCLFKIYLALRARYLSCSACAIHFERALKAMPNDTVHRTRAGLLRWLCGVHNDVNRRKQRQPMPEDEILAHMNEKAAVPNDEDEDHTRHVTKARSEALSSAGACPSCSAHARLTPAAAAAVSSGSPPLLLTVAGVLAAALLLGALASSARMLSWGKRASGR